MIEGLPTKSIWKDKAGKLHINIWPKQNQFLQAENLDEIFYGGAAGGGKSEALLHFALQRRLKYPKTLGIIFRRKFPDLQKSLILRSKNYYGLAGGKYNESKHEWKFPNGSVQMFGFCKTDGDVYDHQSAEYHDMGFDELTHFTEFQFGYLTSRCRSSMPGVKAIVRGASNPGNIGHLWVKKRYIDPSKTNKIWYNEQEHKQMTFIPSLLDDNPSLRLNDPTYEHRLRILGEKKFQALRFGNWDVFEGQYFDEWDGRHGFSVLAAPRVPERHHRKFIAMDWGFANPSCVLWFEVTPTGRVYVYRELYTSRRTNKQLASDILSMCPDEEEYEGIYIPPELFGKKSEKEGGGETYAEEMQSVFRSRLSCLKANNARIPGWIKVRQYLAPAQDQYPWLQISPVCKDLVRTLPMMIHDADHPEDIDTDGEDHACIAGTTVLRTESGFRSIDSLVGTEGRIWTPAGWKEYTGVSKTRFNTDTLRVYVGDMYITTTPDHKFMTPLGWKEAKDLVQGQSVLIQSDTWNPRLFRLRFKNLLESVITYVETTFNDKVCGYIELFGNIFSGKFLKDFMCIIGITIPHITGEKISGCCGDSIIYPYTESGLLVRSAYPIYGRSENKPQGGILLQKGESGTLKMEKNVGVNVNGLRKFVMFVGNRIRHRFLPEAISVDLIAKCVGLENSTQFACVSKIESAGKRDVYNLSVKDVHCYFANSSFLIKNCDALRYGVVGLNEIPKAMVTPRSFIDQVFGRRDDNSNAPSTLPLPGRGGY